MRKQVTKNSITTNSVLTHFSEKYRGVAIVSASLNLWLRGKPSLATLFSVVLASTGSLHSLTSCPLKCCLFLYFPTGSLLYSEVNGGIINQFPVVLYVETTTL